MKKTIIAFIILSFLNIHAWALDTKQARSFFNKYIKLSKSFDVSVGTLYSDSAKISSVRQYPDKPDQVLDMTGAQWKKLAVKVMPLAKQQGDVSKFSNINTSIHKNEAKIKADRYSVLKDYTDTGYYMIIKEFPNGKIQIIEEYSETQPPSDDSKKKILTFLMQNETKQIKKHLPIMVDEDTRLDDVLILGNTFQYQYSLFNLSIDELDISALAEILKPTVHNQSCTMPNLKKLLNNGATISFLYQDKDGKDAVNINVTSKDCKK